jgi:sugar lactone lactonase YvrE/enterochelin esterase-like enzyme
MKHYSFSSFILFILISILTQPKVLALNDYKPGPDSKIQPGVPQGEIISFKFEDSKIFPGTTRSVSIYIPAQYTASKPACLAVFQDGVIWSAPVVFDNLIAKGEVPIILGVFVTPGIVKSLDPTHALDRFNRSYEYDGLGDNYSRFLLEEVLPLVKKHKTSKGLPILISDNPNDRMIAGQSSGAIAAFTAAWEKPDSFRRVYTTIGTFVGLRGGERYSTLIRKTEPKPIRIFMQDGSNDHNTYGGDWWMANQSMERSLQFAGYDVNHIWGDGEHNSKHPTLVFPDALRWLWRDYPKPIEVGKTQNPMLNDILIPGENWQLLGDTYSSTDGPAASQKGEVYFNDRPTNTTYKVSLSGKVSVFLNVSGRASGEIFGPDGRLYSVLSSSGRIVARDERGQISTIATGILHGNDIVVAHNGMIYVTDDFPISDPTAPSKIWLIHPDHTKQIVDTGLRFANGITLSPDQSFLYVDDSRTHWVYSYQILADGTLINKQRFGHLHIGDGDDDTSADGMRADRDGRLYVTTKMGIQVCDQIGRVNAIIPTPNGKVTNLCFGGKDFDILYAVCGNKVYYRKVKVRGANGWDLPNKPLPPKL